MKAVEAAFGSVVPGTGRSDFCLVRTCLLSQGSVRIQYLRLSGTQEESRFPGEWGPLIEPLERCWRLRNSGSLDGSGVRGLGYHDLFGVPDELRHKWY